MISETCRLRAKSALRSKLNREENITVFEKYLHQMYGENERDYLHNAFQLTYDVHTTNMTGVLKDLKEGKYGWHHKSLGTYRDIEYEQDAFIIQPFEIIEGVVECKCGSKRVYTFSKQTRSGDESITTFNECLICKTKWVYSG